MRDDRSRGWFAGDRTAFGPFEYRGAARVSSSRVWARAIESSTDPTFVENGAIPWLLLTASGTEPGPAGGAFFTQTAFIQRVNTRGGAAPSTGCTQRGDIGALVLVPYEADYFFYTYVGTAEQ